MRNQSANSIWRGLAWASVAVAVILGLAFIFSASQDPSARDSDTAGGTVILGLILFGGCGLVLWLVFMALASSSKKP